MRPTPEQELLLRAALLPAPAGAVAWAALRPRLDLDRLDVASQRLLPLVYRALGRAGIDDPWLPRLREAYMQAWARNLTLFRRAAVLLEQLAQAEIPTLVLKGAALVHSYYGDDPGLRPMDDFDVVVPFARAPQAVEVLHRAGWHSRHAITPSFLRVKHAYGFSDDGAHACDLHWHVFEECCRPDDDDDLWQASQEIEFRGQRTRVLSPADQLLHVCAHGFKWAEPPGIRWVADAMSILARGPIDWSRVVEQARRRRYVLRLRATLGFLRVRMSVAIPDAALKALAAVRVDGLERFETRTLRRDHRLLGQLLLYWCHHRRGRDGGPLSAALTLPGYLQDAWGLPTLRAVPAGALARAKRRLGGARR